MKIFTSTDFVDEALYGAHCAAIAIIAPLLSTAVNQIAHKIFRIDDDWDSAPSWICRAGAMEAGMYLIETAAPKSAISNLMSLYIVSFITSDVVLRIYKKERMRCSENH